MFSYCPKFTKKTPKIIKNRKPMPLSKCAVCDTKKLRFSKEQTASKFLDNIDEAIISPFVATD